MRRKIPVFIILLFFQACAMQGYKAEKDSRLRHHVKLDENTSIVITNVDTKSVAWNEKVFDRDFTHMDWCLHDNQKCSSILNFSPYTKMKSKSKGDVGDYEFYLSKSGYYYLDETMQNTGYLENWYWLPIIVPLGVISFGNITGKHANFSTSPSGWNKKLNAPNFASFETKPGEIVYIGDLYFTFTKQKYWIRGKINLDVQDNYDEAVKYFREKFPEYKNKPVIKRLVQPGVMLDNYDAGIFW